MSAIRAAADVIALKAPNFHILDFKFHADFHDLRARNLEICAGPLGIVVHECKQLLAPSRQARPSAPCSSLRVSRRIFPFIQRIFADSRYAGEKITTATSIAVEIVRKKPDQVGFAVNPRRWVVEQFFASIRRNRRLTKDFEATINSARAFLYVASVMLLVRRIARAS